MDLERNPANDAAEGRDAEGQHTAALAAALRLAVARITRRLRRAHAVGDVTLSGVSVLARLAGAGPDSPGSLADLERVRPQAMATTLAGLEHRGLVRRTPDATDGRRAIVSITDEGRTMLEERRSESVGRLARALDEFTPRELRTLQDALPLLDRLAQQL